MVCRDLVCDQSKGWGKRLGIETCVWLGGAIKRHTWLHKMRQAMVCPGRDRLCGRIEVDEMYVGGSTIGGK